MSFLSPLTLEDAESWWRTTLGNAIERSIFLVARDADGISGTVQMHPAWAPNQPHRGEIVKLLIHSRAQRSGLGTRLMETIENEARRAGIRLLTLDTKAGTVAEHLYVRQGWSRVGAIPQFALDPDGKTPHDAVIFYKDL